MKRTRRRIAIVGAVVLAAAAISGGYALAGGSGDEQPLTGSTKEDAVDAALAQTGGGTVLETEVGDDGAAYEVEVRRPDGTTVEVELGPDFSVLSSEADDDGAEGDDESRDDD